MTDLELIERAWRAGMRSIEELAIFDRAGHFEYCISGDENSVPLYKAPLGAPMNWKGKILTHYHTSLTLANEHIEKLNNPLSYVDLRTAFQYELLEIRAVCDNWIYSFKPSKQTFGKQFYALCVQAGTIADSSAKWKRALVKLAKLTKSKYTKIPFKEAYK
jgi:hypothetical protein